MVYWGFWISKVLDGYRALDAQPLRQSETQAAWKDEHEPRPSANDLSYDKVKALYSSPHGRPAGR